MELDDLKQVWQQQTTENIDVRNDKKIIDMIQDKNYGPLATIKSKYLRGFIFVGIAYAYLTVLFITTPQKWQNFINNKGLLFLFVFLVPFAIIQYWSRIRSLKAINRIQNINEPIKRDIEKQMLSIQKDYKLQNILYVVSFALMGVFFEMLTQQRSKTDMADWYNVPMYLRVLAYIGLVILSYFYGKWVFQKRFGKHIDYLKNMLCEME
jgi:hypothetical protein